MRKNLLLSGVFILLLGFGLPLTLAFLDGDPPEQSDDRGGATYDDYQEECIVEGCLDEEVQELRSSYNEECLNEGCSDEELVELAGGAAAVDLMLDEFERRGWRVDRSAWNGGVHCPPTLQDRASGEAVPAGDLDGDGIGDWQFPGELAGTDCKVFCYSNGGGLGLFILQCAGRVVHRCPYIGGQNLWTVDEDGTYRGSSTDDGGGGPEDPKDDDEDGKVDSVEYEYDPETGRLTIIHKEDGVEVGRTVIDAPSDAGDLPWPEDIPREDSR